MKELELEVEGRLTQLEFAEAFFCNSLREDETAPFFPLVTRLRQQMECSATQAWHLTRVALRRLVERGVAVQCPSGFCLRGPRFE